MVSGSFLTAGEVLGEFTIQRLLGEGGMGAVYVAKQASTGRLRALKVIQPNLLGDEKLRSRFLEEATISAGVKSANIVEVVSAGVDERSKIPWIAMELLQGEPLDQRIGRGPMSVADVAEVFRHLSDAIGAAHDVGIIHRDLKPENLFLSTLASARLGWIVKVLDFGIARVLRENQSAMMQTSNAGSPLYMAPEQASTNTPIRTSTDVWALGLIAFRLLANKEYWLAANVESPQLNALYAEILVGDLAPASVRSAQISGHSLPDGFDEWFARCVTRGERWKHGRDACLALVKLLEGAEQAPKPPPPTPPPPPPPPPPPRNRIKWFLVAGFATSLVVLVAVMWRKSRESRNAGTARVAASDARRVTEIGSTPRDAALLPAQSQPDASQVDAIGDVQAASTLARRATSTRLRVEFVLQTTDSRSAGRLGSSICQSAHPSFPIAWQVTPHETDARRALIKASAAGCAHSAGIRRSSLRIGKSQGDIRSISPPA